MNNKRDEVIAIMCDGDREGKDMLRKMVSIDQIVEAV